MADQISQAAGPRPLNLPAYAVLIVISVFCLLPCVWLFLASVDSNAKLFLKWPHSWTPNNYACVFAKENGGMWFLNSMFTVGASTILAIIMSGLGGYALSRSTAWWKLPFLYSILLIRVIPSTALIVPLYKILLTNKAEASVLRPLVGQNFRPMMRSIGFRRLSGADIGPDCWPVAAGVVDHEDLL